MPDNNNLNSGGINHERTNRHRYFQELKRTALLTNKPAPAVTDISADADNHLVIHGHNFTADSSVLVDGHNRTPEFVSPTELRIDRPADIKPHSAIHVNTGIPTTLGQLGQKSTRLTLNNIRPLAETPLKTATPFTLAVEFQPKDGVQVKLLRLKLAFPDGQIVSKMYKVSAKESKAGQKLIEGIKIGNGGDLDIDVALYDDAGNADYREIILPVVPSNPLQLYVYPQHISSGTNKGAADYRSSNNRYYAEGRWVISNGNSFAVTIGPSVRCRVSDAGLGELADFTFNITQRTIAANSTITIYVNTYHGSSSDVYDLFKDFGDAKYEFWLQTSEGDKYDWNVWVAMAQIGVTANFVGSFSSTERLKIREIIDTYATAIYSEVDCIFSVNTPLLVLPSSHADWSRYRDIHVEENKSGNCVDSDEADDLRDDWSSPSQYNDMLDLFFVESFSGDACASSLGGFSPVDGPTGKGGKSSGIVIDVKDLNILTSSWGEQIMGIVIAHEVGHFLGLDHISTNNNFMEASVGTSNVDISYTQWKEMREHGFINRLNP